MAGEEVIHYSSCMFADVTQARRPVATVPARPRRLAKKAVYRHIPHRDKPPQLVARRNARERRRVQAVNAAFIRLRQVVPGDSALSRGKRVSKVKTLQRAIEYIYILQELLAVAQQQEERHDVSQEKREQEEEDLATLLLHDLSQPF